MARGGINKALVLNAYEALTARGENPSLDAIRIELGNTGSKTTIQRYVKEIEGELISRSDREGLLSDAVLDLAAKLASQLKLDADIAVEEAEAQFLENERKLKQKVEKLNSEVIRLEGALESATVDNEQKISELKGLSTELTTVKQELSIAHQRAQDQEKLLDEKDKAIASLEQKHLHNREAMEHYRQSVKEQREQDLRRHEQLLQEEKLEVRNLQQTLSIKQHELTESARANAELSTNVSSLRNELSKAQSATVNLDRQINELNVNMATSAQRLSALNNDKSVLLEKLEVAEESKSALETQLRQKERELERELAEIRGSLSAKDEIIQSLIKGDQKAANT